MAAESNDAMREEDAALREREKKAIFTAMRESIENYHSGAAVAAAKQAVESGVDLL